MSDSTSHTILYTSGSHVHITCRSIHIACRSVLGLGSKWDQNGIKCQKRGYVFALWTPIQSCDEELRKETIKWLKTIFTNQDSWYQLQMLLQVLFEWSPLVHTSFEWLPGSWVTPWSFAPKAEVTPPIFMSLLHECVGTSDWELRTMGVTLVVSTTLASLQTWG